MPLQASPSSLAAQSASVLQTHTLVADAQAPCLQVSSTVQILPSLQSVPWLTGISAQVPVCGSHTLAIQVLSATLGQTTVVAGFRAHLPVARLQNGTPLHRSPSSWQSASPLHSHVNLPGVQMPTLQVSPVVQAYASSHGAPLGTTDSAQLPVVGSQRFLTQAVSLTVTHATTLAGLMTHFSLTVSQYAAPLQKLPSSGQSASFRQAQACTLPSQLPATHVSTVVQATPSSQALPSVASPSSQAPVRALQAFTTHPALVPGQLVGFAFWQTPKAQRPT